MYTNVFIMYELSSARGTAIARLSFKRRATAELKSIWVNSDVTRIADVIY